MEAYLAEAEAEIENGTFKPFFVGSIFDYVRKYHLEAIKRGDEPDNLKPGEKAYDSIAEMIADNPELQEIMRKAQERASDTPAPEVPKRKTTTIAQKKQAL